MVVKTCKSQNSECLSLICVCRVAFFWAKDGIRNQDHTTQHCSHIADFLLIFRYNLPWQTFPQKAFRARIMKRSKYIGLLFYFKVFCDLYAVCAGLKAPLLVLKLITGYHGTKCDKINLFYTFIKWKRV